MIRNYNLVVDNKMEKGNALAKVVYNIYMNTTNGEDFIKEIRKNSIYSNCEEDVLQTMWELIELMYDVMS